MLGQQGWEGKPPFHPYSHAQFLLRRRAVASISGRQGWEGGQCQQRVPRCQRYVKHFSTSLPSRESLKFPTPYEYLGTVSDPAAVQKRPAKRFASFLRIAEVSDSDGADENLGTVSNHAVVQKRPAKRRSIFIVYL